MHLIHLTDWRNGSASDSSPYRLWCVAATAWRRWRGGYAIMPSPRPRRAVERTQIDDENHRVSIIEKRGVDGTITRRFFLCTVKTDWLDGKHVVFGSVTKGMDVVKKVEAVGSSSGRPSARVLVAASGELPQKHL